MENSGTFDTFLTEAEERQLFKALRAHSGWQAARDLHAIQLMRSTGCRVGTLCGLTVDDALSALSSKRLAFRPEICKRKHGYEAEVTAKVEAALRGLLAIRRELKLGLDPAAPLLVPRVKAREGRGMTTRAVQLRLVAWRKRAGLSVPLTPHWLRHTLGHRIMRNSSAANPLEIAALALNHADINTTRIYTRPTRADRKLALVEAGA